MGDVEARLSATEGLREGIVLNERVEGQGVSGWWRSLRPRKLSLAGRCEGA